MRSLRIVVAIVVFGMQFGFAAAQDDRVEDLQKLLEAVAGTEILEDPESIFAWVAVPREVNKDDALTLEITIENARDEEVFRLRSVDLAKSFLDGFKVLEMTPKPRNQSKYPGFVELEYPIDVPAGETKTFRIELKAQKRGVFIGDVDIYEGGRFLTRVAQARVK